MALHLSVELSSGTVYESGLKNENFEKALSGDGAPQWRAWV